MRASLGHGPLDSSGPRDTRRSGRLLCGGSLTATFHQGGPVFAIACGVSSRRRRAGRGGLEIFLEGAFGLCFEVGFVIDASKRILGSSGAVGLLGGSGGDLIASVVGRGPAEGRDSCSWCNGTKHGGRRRPAHVAKACACELAC